MDEVVSARQMTGLGLVDKLVVGKDRGVAYLYHYALDEAQKEVMQKMIDSPHLMIVGEPTVSVTVEYTLGEEF